MSSTTRDIEDNQIVEWGCGGGHVLGQVVKEPHGSVLLLYRTAVKPGEGEVEVMAVVEGRVIDVLCSICGKTRTWFRDANAVKHERKKLKRQEQTGNGRQCHMNGG